MKCKRCHKYTELSTIKGYKGLCIECECYKMEKEFEEQADAELAAYNGTHGTDYDFDDFYYACWENDIAKHSTIGLPMLNDIFNTVLSEKKYLAQAEFNFDNNLPF